MIVRPRPNWFAMLFVWHGSVLRSIVPQLIFTAALATLVTMNHGTLFRWKVTLNFVPFTLIGVALAIFVSFRNSASYERYWEGRKLWGTVLNDARTLTRQALSLFDPPVDATPFVHGLIGFVHAMRHQLRGTDPMPQLRGLLPADCCDRLEAADHRPALVLHWCAQWLHGTRQHHGIAPELAAQMERPLAGLTDALGGCERIAGTPLPFAYSLILHRTVYLYCFLLPFGLVDTLGAMTPLIVAFIAYTFFSIEALSAELEDPFGTMPNDLALESITRTIESSLREMLGEPLPEPLRSDVIHTDWVVL
jgi:putative membrane protein